MGVKTSAANDPSVFIITEKALVGAFSVIVKTDGSFAALGTRQQIGIIRLF